MTVFLTAPKDLQQGSSYEEVLELLHELHDGEEVVADRDLFEDNEHWRKSWRSIYSKAERLYVLAREDGTVGKGIFQQWRFLSKKDVPAVVVFESKERAWYERFSLEIVGARGDGEGDDMVRYALVHLGGESR
jgi:hypothetical protein